MKRLLVLLLFLATPAMAADWYFSDCATYCQDGAVAIGTGACTGAGTDINNPICLDWDNDGSDEGWGYVQDGTAPEVGSGDTVYLCCGDCDGAGTCTHNQDDVITIQNAGPVTVSGYPGETVTYDGGSTVADYTLGVVRHVYVTVETYDDWTFQNYNLQHYQSYFFHALNAPDGWTIQNMTMKWLDALQDDSSVGDTSTCGKGYAGDTYGIYFRTGNPSGAPTATLTIANIDMHSICKFALRFNSLSNGTAIIVEDNTFYNMAGVTNGFNNSGQRIRRNTVYDVEVPFSEEWGTIDLIIEDNIIECRGTYNMDSGRCQQAIQINESDNPPGEIDGICNDIIIRRNKIIGYASSGQGSWYSGITYLCECLDSNGCVTLNATIENNFLQRIVPNITGGTCLGPRHGLSLITNKPVTVRHNTIRESSLGMIICGNGTVAHNVYGNIIEDPLDALPGVWIEADAASSTFNDNNVYRNSEVSNVIIDYAGGGTDRNCSAINLWDSGTNICLPTDFVADTGGPETWDLHLDATDTNNIDAGDCTSGPTEDIDQGARTATCDIGADERGSPAGIDPTYKGVTLSELKAWSCEMREKTGAGACFP